MKILLIYLLNICFLSQVINASKSDNNIVLSGGGGGCKDSGALVMQSGQKGKKNEKLIIKDDALIMQDSQADGNIVMDGNNLIWKEGKKSENIVIKGGGAGDCCHQDIHHKEEHVHHPMPHTIPVHHFKKKEVHHHHSKEVHHHNDDLGLGSRRRDVGAESEKDADSSPAKEKEKDAKRKAKKKKPKMRKLKLGDKLSQNQKEHLKLRRVDRRLGLARFRLAGKVMDKIRWRKGSQKTNSPEKAKEIKQEEPPAKEGASGEQQYDDDESEDGGRDQEDDEPPASNLYEGMASALYPAALNPHPMSTGYMTNGFSGMLDPSALLPSPVLIPASTASPSDRRDLKKKHAKKQAKRIKKSENVKEHIKEDNGHQKTGSEKSGTDQSEEVDSDETGGDDEEGDNSLKLNKTINHAIEATTTGSPAALKGNLLQPVFAPAGRQLTPLYSLIALTNGVQNRLTLPPTAVQLNQAGPTATLPLFTPAKPTLDSSAALLLKLIEHQSQQQQQLIRAQHKKLLEQEVRQKELTKQLQQATEEKQKEKLQDDFPKDEEPDSYDRPKERANDKSKLLYANELDYWDKFVEDDKYDRANRHVRLGKYDKASINRLRRRKSEGGQFDQSAHPMSLIKKSKQEQALRAARVTDEFNFSDFDEDLEPAPGKRLRSQQQFERRMLHAGEPEFAESSRIANVTSSGGPNGDSDKRPDSDPGAPANEMKLARNASLIVYGY